MDDKEYTNEEKVVLMAICDVLGCSCEHPNYNCDKIKDVQSMCDLMCD